MYRFSAYILTGVAVAGLVYWGGNYRYQQGLDAGLDKLQQYCYTTGGYVVGAETPHTIIEFRKMGRRIFFFQKFFLRIRRMGILNL